MRPYLLTFLFCIIFNNLFSQKVTVWDNITNSLYEVDIPDTVYVVTGEKVDRGDFYFIDYEDFLGKDLFFLDEPRPSQIWIEEWEEWGDRIDLSYMREVFFDDYFRQDFELESNLELYRIHKFKFSKYSLMLPFMKKVNVVPYNSYGKRVTEKDFFEIKNSFQTVLNILMRSAQKKKD